MYYWKEQNADVWNVGKQETKEVQCLNQPTAIQT